MASVTKRIKDIKQPRGGYVKLSDFDMILFNDGYAPYPEENIHSSIVGMAVDYLTRFMMGEKKEEVFRISIQGAMYADKVGFKGASKVAYDLFSDIMDFDTQSIISACKLVSFDVWRRNPMAAGMAKTYSEINPNNDTIDNIALFVSRGITFFNNYGPIVRNGFTFEPPNGKEKDYLKMKKNQIGSWGGYTPTIDTGDGDYLTSDTIWDFKVLSSKPKPQHTLQLLVYWVMGQHSGQSFFKSITKVGIFNPRMNMAYLLDMSSVSGETIKAIEDEVICY